MSLTVGIWITVEYERRQINVMQDEKAVVRVASLCSAVVINILYEVLYKILYNDIFWS